MEKNEFKGKLKDLLAYYRSYSEQEIEQMSEDDTRAKFIDPLLKDILGWDERDIDRQKSIESLTSEGHMKRADYSYPKIPKLIVEAKKAQINIDNGDFDNQVLDYAYSKAVNWAILTNFRSFRAWYVTRKGKNMFCRLNLVEDNIDQIVDELFYFTKDNIFNGVLDKMAEVRGIKLQEINITGDLAESFNILRQRLNNYLKKEYESKYPKEIEREEITQGILNRLIFIKKIEAEGLEENKLEQLVRQERENIYEKLTKIFSDYRKKYDSDIFGSPERIADVEELKINDSFALELLRIISGPLNSDRQYNFATIDVDVLGSVYENYIAYMQKGIKLVGGKVKRKEQGIYYTPKFIVNYIVQETLGKILSTLSLPKVKKLKILDMACGSGSFLIGALRELDKYYNKTIKGYENFSIRNKLNIIKNNIYGVDLDEKAVTIAELNIYLTLFSLAKKQKTIETHELLLPELKDNIKVGNSLIDDPEYTDKPFDWKERFAKTTNGKFNIIIGNPPYIRPHHLDAKTKKFLWSRSEVVKAKGDIYAAFIEKGIDLLDESGYLSFIVPHSWLSLESFEDLREYILDTCVIRSITLLPTKVFKDATVETLIFVFQKCSNAKRRKTNKIEIKRLIENGKVVNLGYKVQSEYRKNGIFSTESQEASDIFSKIDAHSEQLGSLINFFYGIKTADDKKFLTFHPLENGNYKKIIRSSDIDRYRISFKGEYVNYRPDLMKSNKSTARPGEPERFEEPKIIIMDIAKKLVCTYDDKGYYVKDALILKQKEENVSLKYLVGLINSKLLNFYYTEKYKVLNVAKNAFLRLPIKIAPQQIQKEIETLVDKILAINEEIDKTNSDRERGRLIEQRDKFIEQINGIVYAIYGLTEKERDIIERS